jgi:hypothetical protein
MENPPYFASQAFVLFSGTGDRWTDTSASMDISTNPEGESWLEAIELRTAYPYHDWNERITRYCTSPTLTDSGWRRKNHSDPE